jgi:prefoldin alpha subunit
MIPVTSSLYVPGRLSNNSTVIVDIGSSFFARKTINEAREFFNVKNRVNLFLDFLLEKLNLYTNK